MLVRNFFAEFKLATETKWSTASLDPDLYGFQFQRGTKWNPALSNSEIMQYERRAETRFPYDFVEFLRHMNGTDLPTLNIYGHSGHQPQESPGVYSYPKDMGTVQRLIEDVRRERAQLTSQMDEQGFHIPAEAALIPLYGRRYLVYTSRLDQSVVLSIDSGHDAIVYGNSLEEYLTREFLLS